MQKRKLVNYIAGLVAVIHAGVTSMFMQEIFNLPNLPTSLNSYEQVSAYLNTIPEATMQSLTMTVWGFFLCGLLLFVLGVVTLIMNMRLDAHTSIKRLAVTASVMTLVGVSISVIPLVNIIYPIILAILYVVAAYFMPVER